MEKIGKDLRKGYIEDNQFLPNEFKPQNFYLKAYRDEPSVLSSYSSMLGAYPNSINWIQYQHMQGYSQAPFDRDDEEKVRNNLGLGTNPSKLTTREATIWSEANGRTFFNDPVSNCPQMQKQMEQNLEAANKKYTENRRFDALYEEMGETFDVNKNDINFKTAHLYLDDYITSQANQKPVPEFDEQVVADQWIQNYYRRYYYEGLYGDDNDLAKVASNHYFNYVLTSMYAKYKTDKGEINSDHYENLKYAQFTGNENAMIAAIKVLNEKNADPAMPPKFGSTIRYELFKDGDKYFVKGTLDGKPLNMNGDEDGVMPYEDFMNLVYNRLYFGDVDKYCQGTEPLHGKDKPILSSYEEHIWNTNPELRINQQLENRGNTKFVEQSFVELKQTPTSEPKPKPEPEPKVEQVVEEYTVYEPYIPAQQAPTQTYQPQVTPITQQRLYSTSSQPQRQYTIESRGPTTYSYPPKQYSKPTSSQTYVTRMPQTTSQYVVAQPSDNVEFSNLVETSATQYNEPPKREFPKVYDPHTTRENKVDIPFLHPVEVDQLVHDTKVIKVPQKVVKEKIVKIPQPYYKEQVVKVPEKPTNIHHIDLSSEEVGPSVSFAQQEPAKSNSWPWWWWLPLLFLCCCLPLLCCLLWYFCCRKTTAPPPQKIPRAPSYRAEPKPIVKEETDIDRQKKYTYSKRKVDQEQEIENEIERELRVSRSRRTLYR